MGMFHSVLVVCVGNICRSPLGAALLRQACPDIRVGSAGLGAVVGANADRRMSAAADEIGIDLSAHVATQLTRRLATAYDLVLVMQSAHRDEIGKLYPEVAGRTFLLGQWIGGIQITDPYRMPLAVHRQIRDEINLAVQGWTKHLQQ